MKIQGLGFGHCTASVVFMAEPIAYVEMVGQMMYMRTINTNVANPNLF
jgi:hypothetical protein